MCARVCVCSVNLSAEQTAVRETGEHIVEHIRIRLHSRLNYISRLLMRAHSATVRMKISASSADGDAVCRGFTVFMHAL